MRCLKNRAGRLPWQQPKDKALVFGKSCPFIVVFTATVK